MGSDVKDGADTIRGLSSNLLCERQGDILRIGLGGEASVNDHLHALIDLLAWHHYEVARGG
jgi:hypothetical protein